MSARTAAERATPSLHCTSGEHDLCPGWVWRRMLGYPRHTCACVCHEDAA